MSAVCDPVCTLQVCGAVERVGPTFAGLLAIPFIVHPIDNAVHFAMNKTMRPYMQAIICDSGGREAGLAVCNSTQPTGALLVVPDSGQVSLAACVLACERLDTYRHVIPLH
jgi:ectoine hydroxylase-related dioxygenase (phytanoyl-CoA dioxygenase family)